MKKIFLVVGFILVVFGLAWLLYSTFFKPMPLPSVVNRPAEETTVRLPVAKDEWEKMTIEERERLGLPALEWIEGLTEIKPEEPVTKPEAPEISETAAGGLTWTFPVSEETATDAEIARDGQSSVYYHKESGKFYEIAPDGTRRLLTDQVFHNVEKVIWSPDKGKVILEYPDGFKTIYDFQKKKSVSLPKEWYDFSFNSSGREIVFKTDSKYPEDRWLAIAQADGTNAKVIEHLGENQDKVIINWSPNNQVIAFSRTGEPRGTFEQEILLIGRHGENFRSLIVDGQGFEAQWSPLGDKITYSVYSDQTGYKPTLYVVEAQGDRIGYGKKNLGLQTWAHKCTSDQSGGTLYCAVPRDLPYGSSLVPELAVNTKDDFYKVDLRTGRTTFLAEGAFGSYNVKKVFLSADGSLLYFIDKDLGRLRYIRLK